MDIRFWAAFAAGVTLQCSIITALLGNMPGSVGLAVLGIFEIALYGVAKSTEEEGHGND